MDSPTNDCTGCIFLRTKLSIQTMTSICFTFNSVVLVFHVFAMMSSEDAAVYLKLNSIDALPSEIQAITIPRMVLICVTIVIDLFLVIGIEDNVKAALRGFVFWNTFMVVVESLTISGIAIWKGTAENVTLLLACAGSYGCILALRGCFAKQVYDYMGRLGSPNTASVSASLSASRLVTEKHSTVDEDATQTTVLDELAVAHTSDRRTKSA
ncbi:uncharacterized protein LOC135401264 [Ornithodoros turicata]|uniref:uncharacterized protein LOC135401264 n=1 Tax=Ornithodoros turicata TaxID=34597 RepID=UPI003139497D